MTSKMSFTIFHVFQNPFLFFFDRLPGNHIKFTTEPLELFFPALLSLVKQPSTYSSVKSLLFGILLLRNRLQLTACSALVLLTYILRTFHSSGLEYLAAAFSRKVISSGVCFDCQCHSDFVVLLTDFDLVLCRLQAVFVCLTS